MSAVRLRRLQSDYERLTDLARRHPRLSIVQSAGAPPDRYQISYNVRSLRKSGEVISQVSDHLVEIMLPSAFPRTPPLCRMLTPVFHPNIAPHAICIGDHWSPGESLTSLVVRIAEMLAFQSYNTKSPLNGEAAKWVEQNLGQLPLDPDNMQLDESADAPAVYARPVPPPVPLEQTATTPASVSPQTAETPNPALRTVEVACSSCAAVLRVKIGPAAARIRCPKCRNLTQVAAAGGPEA